MPQRTRRLFTPPVASLPELNVPRAAQAQCQGRKRLAASSWHHAFGTRAPHTATDAHRALSLGLLPCQRQTRPTSRAASCGVPPCTVGRCNAPSIRKTWCSFPTNNHRPRGSLPPHRIPDQQGSTAFPTWISTAPSAVIGLHKAFR